MGYHLIKLKGVDNGVQQLLLEPPISISYLLSSINWNCQSINYRQLNAIFNVSHNNISDL